MRCLRSRSRTVSHVTSPGTILWSATGPIIAFAIIRVRTVRAGTSAIGNISAFRTQIRLVAFTVCHQP